MTFPGPQPLIENQQPASNGPWLAVLVGLLFTVAYLCFIGSIDNTNLRTTNGLWKTPQVSAWEHHTGDPLDSGGFLYFPTYGTLARLIPDRWVEYGTPVPVVTFRKMTLLNGIFGGIASGLVWWMALRFTRSKAMSCAIVLVHAGAAFVLLNSVSSEDIIPAYTFFVAASAVFFEYLRSTRVWMMFLAALLMALASLFHWTVMAPGLAAFGSVLGLAMWRRRTYFWVGAAWLFLFVFSIQILLLLCLPHMHIPVWAALLPAKGTRAGGWVGLSREKINYLVIGIGNYFTGGHNDANYVVGLSGGHLRFVVVSWLFFVVTIAICLWQLLRKGDTPARLLAVFALALLAAGEAGAFYSQPQDPQMQIQPMLSCVLGLILAGRRIWSAGPVVRRAAAAILTAVALANGFVNVANFRQGAGGDSQALKQILDLDAVVPLKSTTLVCQGFEEYTTWLDVVFWRGDTNTFRERTLALTRPFIEFHGMTGEAASSMLEGQIDAARAAGRMVVAGALWTESPQQFVASLMTVASKRDAQTLDSSLRAHYRTGKTWRTELGTFVEILPAGN